MKLNPIPYIYYTLAFLMPLAFTGITSEVFEINKIIFIYISAIIIASIWIITCTTNKKFIFRPTRLTVPILIFLASQVLATIVSSDTRTSLLGYYSRFNGGLMSSLSYATLYFGFVNFMDKDKTTKFIKFLLLGGILVSLEGVLEHFGISLACFAIRGNATASCWAESVRERVFSTLGQPNWLAAYLVALLPLAWLMAIGSKLKAKSIFWVGVSTLFFVTLLFTKSRSGLLGYSIAFFIFWSPTLWLGFKQKRHSAIRVFLCLSTIYLLLAAVLIGNPFINNATHPDDSVTSAGGTPSSEIRTLVWQGAIQIWRAHPLLGTGVETFAFNYPAVRPTAHNLTSEWNYTYNKAHNEYLNYLATTGILGLAAYLLVIASAIYQTTKDLRFKIQAMPAGRQDSIMKNQKSYILNHISILASFASILVTNFFGFSVVVTSFLFFILPATVVAMNQKPNAKSNFKLRKLSVVQTLISLSALSLTLYALFAIGKYWYSDTLYAKGESDLEAGNLSGALKNLTSAKAYSPGEGLYQIALSDSLAKLAIAAYEDNNNSKSLDLSTQALELMNSSEKLSPKNINQQKRAYKILTDLSEIDSKYLLLAYQEVINTISLAPTDPSLYTSLGLTSLRLGQTQDAIAAYQNAVELKPDYEKARFALARLFLSQGMPVQARKEVDYVLKYVNPQSQEAINIKSYIEKSH